MARIFITGASGFFGWNAVRYFIGRGHDVVAGFHTLPHYLHKVADCHPVQLELADPVTTGEVVARYQPDIILHAAALARPQRDTDPTKVHQINVLGTASLAQSASRTDIPLVYLSTDLVYPSNAGCCDETSPVDPSGAHQYSSSKLLGEDQVQVFAPRWIIVRSSLMYGDGPARANGFTQFIEGKWSNGQAAPLFTDQFRSFVYVGDLCRAIDHLVFDCEQWNNLYVCGGDERLSRAEFGLRYASAVGVDRGMCFAMRSDELEGYVGGPSDISLDSSKLRATGWNARPLEENVAEVLRNRAVSV